MNAQAIILICLGLGTIWLTCWFIEINGNLLEIKKKLGIEEEEEEE